MNQKMEFITDAARTSAWTLWNPRRVRRKGRDGNTPGNCDVSVRSPRQNSPVLIGGTSMFQARGLRRSLEMLNKQGYTDSEEIGDTQKFDTSVDGKLAEDGILRPFSSR